MSSVFGEGPVLLDTPEKMLQVWKELVGNDASVWNGRMDVWDLEEGIPAHFLGFDVPQNPSKVTWRLSLQNNLGPGDGNSVTAYIGDYLVMTYGRLLKLTADEV